MQVRYRDAQWPVDGCPQAISRLELNQICDIADLGRDDPDVIKLWIGESDLPTPAFICEAAMRALSEGHTRYTFSHGIPALREGLVRYHQRHLDVDVALSRFSVTSGGIQAIMQSIQATMRPGDEVIVPVPAWPNILAVVEINGGTVVPVPYRRSDAGAFYLDLADIAAATTARTRMIAINSPSNPTGWKMSREQMIELRDFARDRGIWLLSDEVYGHITYDGSVAPSMLEITEPADRLIVTNTFSKNWHMTGWRIGWAIFPEGFTNISDNLSQYNTTGVATFLQHGALAALDKGDGVIRELVDRSATAREIICSALDQLPNVSVVWPEATFYLFFSVEGVSNGYELARRILKETSVGLAPGSAFGPGCEEYLRICFAVDHRLIEQAAERLVDFIAKQ